MGARFLSYALNGSVPVYGGTTDSVSLESVRSLAKGDSCQSFWMEMNNHWGTHVDCPAHFFAEGKRVAEYPAAEWIFHSPQVMEVELGEGELLGREHLKESILPATDLLLLRSGWFRQRGKEIYGTKNPGITAEFGTWLREKYPTIRAIGFDWISISSYQKRDEGRKTHRAFLDPNGKGRPILILEDMDLSELLGPLAQVIVSPLRVSDVDSAPCTIIGVFRD